MRLSLRFSMIPYVISVCQRCSFRTMAPSLPLTIHAGCVSSLESRRKRYKKGRPYQNYIEAAFGVQRRMADWSFEKAHTWEDLLAAHDKWMKDYNFQRHLAHENRDDNCHSPAAVLQWIKGVQPEPELVYMAFSAMCETR